MTVGGPGAGRWTSCSRWPRTCSGPTGWSWRGRRVRGGAEDGARGPEISVSLQEAVEHLRVKNPILTVGGSQWFDVIGRELVTTQARIVLRAGAYVTHDDGYYREHTPFNRVPGELRPALEVWAHVLSTPEPGLAIVGLGKRDAPYDEGLPVPRRGGVTVVKMQDQHTIVRADGLQAGRPAGLRHLPPVHRLRQVAHTPGGRPGLPPRRHDKHPFWLIEEDDVVKKELKTDEGAAPVGAYSQGLVVGDFVYTSGMGPLDPQTGEVVGDDVAAQTHQIMRNLGAILAAHGLGFDDVVKATVHLQHLKRDFAAYNEVVQVLLHPARIRSARPSARI